MGGTQMTDIIVELKKMSQKKGFENKKFVHSQHHIEGTCIL